MLNYFMVSEGRFQDEPQECPRCKLIYTIPKEKKTDVAIAVEMVCDAFNNEFDVAILTSEDADLVPGIEAIKNNFQDKRIVVAVPLGKNSEELIKVAHAYLRIGRSHFDKVNYLIELSEAMALY